MAGRGARSASAEPLQQFLGVFPVGDPQDDHLGPANSVVGPKVSAAKAIQRRLEAAEALEPGLSNGKRGIRQMSCGVLNDLDCDIGGQSVQIGLSRGAIDDPKLCGRHVCVSAWPAWPRR